MGNDDTVVDVLITCESTLSHLLSKMAEDNTTKDLNIPIQKDQTLLKEINDNEMVASRPYNQRVALPDNQDMFNSINGTGMYGDGMDQENDLLGDDGDEDELTRDRIKKASQSILQSHERRGKKKKKTVFTTNLSDSSSPQPSSPAPSVKSTTN